MSPEKIRENPNCPITGICDLFKILHSKKLLEEGRITTGPRIRRAEEKEVRLAITSRNNCLIYFFQAYAVPTDRLIRQQFDLTLTVPDVYHLPYAQTEVSFRTVDHSFRRSLAELSLYLQELEQVNTAVLFINSVLSCVNGQRQIVKDLTGKTLVVD